MVAFLSIVRKPRRLSLRSYEKQLATAEARIERMENQIAMLRMERRLALTKWKPRRNLGTCQRRFRESMTRAMHHG